jgi:DNA (cytosine-5)-methyltransferase 1
VTTKPPYRVPSMDDVRALEWNGFNAVSTFSGCGGSSLGYRMAGFRMLWASEFVPAAQDTYRANASSRTVLDTRDIREVTGRDILKATRLAEGEIDLFDGSPPCAAFSTSGKREKGWGVTKSYSDTVQRVDDLFFEYARLIRETQPRTFVAENVSGLVKGTSKGYFKLILAALRKAGYRVEARVLDASWLGVPQIRQRLILVGVREDLGLPPVFPRPLPYAYTASEALEGLPAPARSLADYFPLDGEEGMLTHDPETGERISFVGRAIEPIWRKLKPGTGSLTRFNLKRSHPDKPTLTIVTTGAAATPSITHWSEPRKFTLAELRRIGGFPDDFVLTGSYVQRWERIGRAVPPVMMSHIASTIRDDVLTPLRDKGVI